MTDDFKILSISSYCPSLASLKRKTEGRKIDQTSPNLCIGSISLQANEQHQRNFPPLHNHTCPPLSIPSKSLFAMKCVWRLCMNTTSASRKRVYAKPLETLLRTDWYSMSSSSFAWNSVAIPFSARLRASLEEAYTILG